MSYLQEVSRKTYRQPKKAQTFTPKKVESAPQQNLTQQQQSLACSRLDGTTQVNAYAGTGKTSSLTALAANNLNARCLYLAYNKSAQQDAATRFGSNTHCTTVHGLAFPAFGRKYNHKLGNLRAIDVIKRAQLSWDWEFAIAVVSTITAWCVSDAEEFPVMPCSIEGPIYGELIQLKEIAEVAKNIWACMCDPNDPMPMSHDGYLKLYQLSKPRINCDLLMLDEAQDTNPVTWAIVKNQKCPIVIVGDRYQAIYKFRGAINAMDEVKPNQVFPLTQSFRFGKRVATLASNLLSEFWNETTKVEGLGPDTRFDMPPAGSAYAILSRTNAAVFGNAVDNLRKGKTLGFVGGAANYGFDKLLDVHYLAKNQNDLIKDKFIKNFDSLGDFHKYSEDSGDLEAKRQIEISSNYGYSLETLIPQIHRTAEADISKAQVVLSTAHRSKGLTMDHVILGDDFPEILDDEGFSIDEEELDRQEINLLYVAATRAKHTLMLNQVARDFT